MRLCALRPNAACTSGSYRALASRVLIQPSGIGGTNWSPMPYSPDTGYFYVPGTVRTSAFTRYGDKYVRGQRYVGGTQAAPIDSPMTGTFTAINSQTNKIAWQHKTPHRIGGGGGSTVTAGGLVFRGEPDGHFLALDAKTGEELGRVPNRLSVRPPPRSCHGPRSRNVSRL